MRRRDPSGRYIVDAVWNTTSCAPGVRSARRPGNDST
jgi:hypothetical protein